MALLFGVQPSQKPPYPKAIQEHLSQNPHRALEIFSDLTKIYEAEKVVANPCHYFQLHFETLRSLCQDSFDLMLLRSFDEETWTNIFFGKTNAFPNAHYETCLALSINLGNTHLIAGVATSTLRLSLKIATMLINTKTIEQLLKHQDKIPLYAPQDRNFSWHDAVFFASKRMHSADMLEIILSQLHSQLMTEANMLLDSFSNCCRNSDAKSVAVFLKYLPVELLRKHESKMDCQRAVEAVLNNGDRDSLLLLIKKDPCFTQYLTEERVQETLEAISYAASGDSKLATVQFLIQRWHLHMPYDFLKSVAFRFAFFGDGPSVEFILAEMARRTKEVPETTISEDSQRIIKQLKLLPDNQEYVKCEMSAYAATLTDIEVKSYSSNPILVSWTAARKAKAKTEEETASVLPQPSLTKRPPSPSNP